jgi:hypothetical protein
MIFVDQLIAIRWRELGKGLLASGIPRLMYDLLKGVDVHEGTFSNPYSVQASISKAERWRLTAHPNYFTVAQ